MKTTRGQMASRILLVLALIGAVVMLFTRPFGIAPFAFLAALVGAALGGTKNQRLGLVTTLFVTLCFVVGVSIAVWSSRSLY